MWQHKKLTQFQEAPHFKFKDTIADKSKFTFLNFDTSILQESSQKNYLNQVIISTSVKLNTKFKHPNWNVTVVETVQEVMSEPTHTTNFQQFTSMQWRS